MSGLSSLPAQHLNSTYRFTIMPVCRFFSSQSDCARGDLCRYEHILRESQEQSPLNLPSWRPTDSIPTRPARAPITDVPDPVAEVTCRFFKQGKCKNGDTCRFRHDSIVEEEHTQDAIIQQVRDHHFKLMYR